MIFPLRTAHHKNLHVAHSGQKRRAPSNGTSFPKESFGVKNATRAIWLGTLPRAGLGIIWAPLGVAARPGGRKAETMRGSAVGWTGGDWGMGFGWLTRRVGRQGILASLVKVGLGDWC